MGFQTGSLPGISHLLGVGRGNLTNKFFFYQKTEGGVTGKGLNKKILIACQRNSLLIFSSHTLVFFMDSSKQFRFDLILKLLQPSFQAEKSLAKTLCNILNITKSLKNLLDEKIFCKKLESRVRDALALLPSFELVVLFVSLVSHVSLVSLVLEKYLTN